MYCDYGIFDSCILTFTARLFGLLQMTVDPSGVGFDLEVPIEVIIGSIPFISVAQRYGFNVQTQVIESPPPGNTDSSNINVAIENTRSLTEPNICNSVSLYLYILLRQ